MDLPTLYYSRYCQKCAKVLEFLSQTGDMQRMNGICVDRRKRDPSSGLPVIITNDGREIHLPPHINNSVPSVVLGKKDKYGSLIGMKQIMDHFKPSGNVLSEVQDGEPRGVSGGTSLFGDSKGYSSLSSLDDRIYAPEDKPERSKGDTNLINLDKLKLMRDSEVQALPNAMMPMY